MLKHDRLTRTLEQSCSDSKANGETFVNYWSIIDLDSEKVCIRVEIKRIYSPLFGSRFVCSIEISTHLIEAIGGGFDDSFFQSFEGAFKEIEAEHKINFTYQSQAENAESTMRCYDLYNVVSKALELIAKDSGVERCLVTKARNF